MGFPMKNISKVCPRPLLFLIDINDLDDVVVYSTLHHFIDKKNLLQSYESIKDLNKSVIVEKKIVQ